MNSDLFEVTKTEIHALSVCSCPACEAERDRRKTAPARTTPFLAIPVAAAHLFGFIKQRSPYGSKARALAVAAGTMPAPEGNPNP